MLVFKLLVNKNSIKIYVMEKFLLEKFVYLGVYR